MDNRERGLEGKTEQKGDIEKDVREAEELLREIQDLYMEEFFTPGSSDVFVGFTN